MLYRTMETISMPKIEITIRVGSSWMNVGQRGRLTIEGIWPIIFMVLLGKRMSIVFDKKKPWWLIVLDNRRP